MAMVPFIQIAGPRAAQETRSITIPQGSDLPAGSYGFIEFYCTDPKCDCRRVIFQVWREDSPGKIWATITYGWDTPAYYARWSHRGMGPHAAEMASATLEPISPQSPLAPALLQLARDLLLQDPAYVERLKRHYAEACPGRASTAPPGSVRSKLRQKSGRWK